MSNTFAGGCLGLAMANSKLCVIPAQVRPVGTNRAFAQAFLYSTVYKVHSQWCYALAAVVFVEHVAPRWLSGGQYHGH